MDDLDRETEWRRRARRLYRAFERYYRAQVNYDNVVADPSSTTNQMEEAKGFVLRAERNAAKVLRQEKPYGQG